MARFNVVAIALISLAVIAPAMAITDADILNFALNLEYLEAEFYLCATSGTGIPATLRGGGPASIGCQMANLTGTIKTIADEIAADELAHVVFLRTALGAAAVAMPLINIGTGPTGAFSIAADAALGMTLNPPFSPYSDTVTFLHGAYIFEDVGVTAYSGAAASITNKDFLTAAAGILAVEGYHAGSIRENLIRFSSYVVPPYGVQVNVIIGAISALRAKLSGAADDSGILVDGMSSLVPTDMNSITYTRNVTQVIAIVTAGSMNGKGLFFPEGLNGAINGSAAAVARVLAPMAMAPGMAMAPTMAMTPGMAMASPAMAPAMAMTPGMAMASPAMAPATAGRKLLAPAMAPAMAATTITDADILNLALNLEYLEAEFYAYATTGKGIPDMYRGGGPASVGGMMANLTNIDVKNFARDVAADELAHVVFLRTALGAAAVPIPLINLGTAFSGAADAALNMTLKPAFSPYGGDLAFLMSSFIFEDVGVTAYKGAAALITNPAYLTAAAGILSVEAYHAGAVRTLLFQRATRVVAPYGVNVSVITGAISALRNKASGSPMPADDYNMVNGTKSNIVPTDSNALAFSRTPAQVINIAVLGSSTGMGGFFTNGLNGVINGTAGSIGSVAMLDAASGSAMGPSNSTGMAPGAAPKASSAFTTAMPSMAAMAVGVASTMALLL